MKLESSVHECCTRMLLDRKSDVATFWELMLCSVYFSLTVRNQKLDSLLKYQYNSLALINSISSVFISLRPLLTFPLMKVMPSLLPFHYQLTCHGNKLSCLFPQP